MAVTPYVAPADLPLYYPAAVLAGTTSAQQTQACQDATEQADSYLRGRYALPLLAWGSDVKMYTAYIAVYRLRSMVGFNSRAGSDSNIVERYYQAVGDPGKPGTGWFPGIQRQAIHPDVTPATPSPGSATYDLPQVATSQARGWQQTNASGKPVI